MMEAAAKGGTGNVAANLYIRQDSTAIIAMANIIAFCHILNMGAQFSMGQLDDCLSDFRNLGHARIKQQAFISRGEAL